MLTPEQALADLKAQRDVILARIERRKRDRVVAAADLTQARMEHERIEREIRSEHISLRSVLAAIEWEETR